MEAFMLMCREKEILMALDTDGVIERVAETTFPEDYLRPPKSFPGLNKYSKAYTLPRLPLFPQQLLLKLQQRKLPMWLPKLYLRPFTLHLLQ
ncbi:hypothetical protein KUCAC02_031107 [Chaenocephalus aceratus]|uniref:Uncharacterized protein n=1 Tax=Chaenocephalus aceratus TaxID=36190 RepID=A0ACB9XN70_CHAAC|nr:hypothetical protein KUCAC02_031107 [Chaenocephalus aceratus]